MKQKQLQKLAISALLTAIVSQREEASSNVMQGIAVVTAVEKNKTLNSFLKR